MSDYSGLADLVEQIRATSRSLEQGDARTGRAPVSDREIGQRTLFENPAPRRLQRRLRRRGF